MRRYFRVPMFNWYVAIHPCRVCFEHLAAAGALVDAIAFFAHIEVFATILAGKVAFVLGGYAVIMLHAEEHRQIAREQGEINSIRKEDHETASQ